MLGVLLTAALCEASGARIDRVTLLRTRKSWDIVMVLSHEGPGERFGIDFWHVATDRGERLKTVHLSRPRSAPETFESWMTDVEIPPDAKTLTIRVHDKVHGFEGSQPFVIDLAKLSGDRYEQTEEVKPLPYRRFFGEHVKRQLRRNGGYVPYEW